MIYTEINESSFRDAFHRAGRGDQFSYDALGVLFEYLDESSHGKQYELDVIAICCDFAEDTPESIAEQYSIDIEGLDDDEIVRTVIEHLNTETLYIGQTADCNLIYLQF